MANKRQLKKQKKKELQNRFKDRKSSFKILIEKEKKSEKRKSQIENRYLKNKELVEKSGYKINITKSMSSKQVQELIENKKQEDKKRKKAQARKNLQERKIQALINAGLSREEAEEFKNATWKEIFDLTEIQHSGPAWLGVCWWDSTGESDLRSVVLELEKMTVEERLEQVNDFYNYAVSNPDDSSDFRGVAMLVHDLTKEKVEAKLEDFKNRGYAWSVPYNFVKIGVSNEFSVEGVVNMLYLSMARTSNIHRQRVYEQARAFFRTYVKSIYEKVFL